MQVPAETLPSLLALINRALTYNGGPCFTREMAAAIRTMARIPYANEAGIDGHLTDAADLIESLLPPQG